MFLFLISCNTQNTRPTADETQVINSVLDHWHQAAAKAKFEDYFSYMSSDAVFIGTDPNEHWDREAFKSFCKPYFDKGKAWNFTSLRRHVYFSEDHALVWFDELLKTQMKICRGSGVLKKEDGRWKIAHYVLSMTIPNEVTNEVVNTKSPLEDKYLDSLMRVPPKP